MPARRARFHGRIWSSRGRATRFSVANVYGRFNEFKGTLKIEGDDFESGSIEIEIRTRSVDTGNTRRDADLRGPDFLNSKQIPVMIFESDSIRFLTDSVLAVGGKMTLLGVTKPVEVEVDLVGLGQNQGTKMIGFDGTFTIKRSDFGMNFMIAPSRARSSIGFRRNRQCDLATWIHHPESERISRTTIRSFEVSTK